MKEKYRIPYQGSKQAIVEKVFNAINNDIGNTNDLFSTCKINTIYDLFCGGGAVGYYFYNQGWKVHMNDYNKSLMELHRVLSIKENSPLTNELLYKWIDREEFKELIKRDDWYGALIRQCWSFGNNGSAYMFGKDIVEYKKQLHFVIVNKSIEAGHKFLEMIGKKNDFNNFSKIYDIKKQKDKRSFIRKYIINNTKNKKFGKHNDLYLFCDKKDFNNIKDFSILEKTKWLNENSRKVIESEQLEQLEQLERLEQLEQLQQLDSLKQLEKLENLEQLQQLKQLQQFQRLENLEQFQRLENLEQFQGLENLEKNIIFYNQSYYDIDIKENSIIYCDPPYIGTSGYLKQTFDFDKFDNWIREKKNQGIKVYISEYTNHNNEWREVASIDKMSLLNNIKDTKTIKKEKIFCNI